MLNKGKDDGCVGVFFWLLNRNRKLFQQPSNFGSHLKVKDYYCLVLVGSSFCKLQLLNISFTSLVMSVFRVSVCEFFFFLSFFFLFTFGDCLDKPTVHVCACKHTQTHTPKYVSLQVKRSGFVYIPLKFFGALILFSSTVQFGQMKRSYQCAFR